MEEMKTEKSVTMTDSAGAKMDLSIELPLLMEPQNILRMRILEADKHALQYHKFVEDHASHIKRAKSLHNENVQWQKDFDAKQIESNKLKEELRDQAAQMQKLEDLNKDLNTQLNDLKLNHENQRKELDKQHLSIENLQKENQNYDCKLKICLTEKESALIKNKKLIEENKHVLSINEKLEIEVKKFRAECEILKEKSMTTNCNGIVETKNVATNTSKDIVETKNVATNTSKDVIETKNVATSTWEDIVETKSVGINTIENIIDDLQMSSDEEDEEVYKDNSISIKQMVSVMTNTLPLECSHCVDLENEITYQKALRQHTKLPRLLSPIPEEFVKSLCSKSVQVKIPDEIVLTKLIDTKIQEVQNVGTMSDNITTEYNSRSAINTYTILSALRKNRDKLLMSINTCGYKYTNNFSKIDLDSPNALPEVMKMMYSFLHDVTESVQDAFEVITKQFNKTSISSYIPQIDNKSADDIILNNELNNLKNGKVKKKRLLKEILDADNNDFDEFMRPSKRSHKKTLLEDSKLISRSEKITNIENKNHSGAVNEEIVPRNYADINHSSHIEYPQDIVEDTFQDTPLKVKESDTMVEMPPAILEDPGRVSNDIRQDLNSEHIDTKKSHKLIPDTDQESAPVISQKSTSKVSEDNERMKRNLEIFAKGKVKLKKSYIKINPIPQIENIFNKSGIQNDMVPESKDRNQSKKKSKRKCVELFGVEKSEKSPKQKRKKLPEKNVERLENIVNESPAVEGLDCKMIEDPLSRPSDMEFCDKSESDEKNTKENCTNLAGIGKISEEKPIYEVETLDLGFGATNSTEVDKQLCSEFGDKSDSDVEDATQKSTNMLEVISDHKETHDLGSKTINPLANTIEEVNRQSPSAVCDKAKPYVNNALDNSRMETEDTTQHLSINMNESQNARTTDSDIDESLECETMPTIHTKESTFEDEIRKETSFVKTIAAEDVSSVQNVTISQMNNNNYSDIKSENTQNIVQKQIMENNTPITDTPVFYNKAETTSLVNTPLVKDNVVPQINNTESYYRHSEITKNVMNYKTTETKIPYQNSQTPVYVLSSLLQKYVVQNGWQSLSGQFPKLPQGPGKKIKIKMDAVVKILAEFLKSTDMVSSLPTSIQKLQQLDLPDISLRFSQCLLYQMSNEWSEIFKDNTQPAAKLVALIHHLGQIYDGFLDFLMKAICYKLFRLKRDNDAFMLFYSQVYIALCIKYNLYSTLSVFLLDSLYCLHYKCMSIVEQLLKVCPTLLQIYEPTQTENILHSTVKHLLWNFKSNGEPLYKTEKMNSIRQMIFFKYKIPENSRNADDLLAKILQKAKCAPDLEIYLSTILLARRESPIWVMNKLINQGYFTLLQMTWNEYVNSTLGDNHEKLQTINRTLSTVTLCLQVLGAVCRTFDEANKDKVISIIFFMKDMLSCKDSPPEVQEAIVSGLIQLSRHQYNTVADAIMLWSPMFLPSLNLINKIKRFIKREVKGFWNLKLNKEYVLKKIKNLPT